MDRPTGVTILAVLNFFGALFCVLGGLVFFVGLGVAGLAVRGGRVGTGPVALLMGMGAVGGVICMVAAALSLIIGIGLWKLQNWARVLTIAFTCLGLLFSAFGILTGLLHFHLILAMFRMMFVAMYALILWYMFQPHVKQAFGAT